MTPAQVKAVQSACRHHWVEYCDYCQNGCGLNWSAFLDQVQRCPHSFTVFHICELCHCSELFLESAGELTQLMKSRSELLAELDASRENETFTVPPLRGVL